MSFISLNLGDAGLKARELDQAKNVEVKEAISPNLFQLGDPEDARFQRLTAPNVRRDLNPLMQERMQQICYYISVTTPFGKRIVELITNYVVGEGFKITCEDPRVQAVVDRFTGDEVNDFWNTLREYSISFIRFGEVCVPVAVNEVDGFVRLGYIDPVDIRAIEFGRIQTSNGMADIMFPVAVQLKQRIGDPTSGIRLELIRTDDDPMSATYGQKTGDCFYFAVNKSKSQSRGISDLFSLADWVDVLDQMVFDIADRARFLNQYIWEFVLKGADQKTVEKFRKDVTQNPPRQGGLLVHNDQVDVNAKTPDFKGADFHELQRTVLMYGAGGAGLPAYWLGDPVDANRSTAEAMEGPTGKKLTDRQNEMKQVVRRILDFVIDQAIAHGVLPQDIDRTFALQVPDLMIKDIQKAATTLQGVTSSLLTAQNEGWIRSETAARCVHVVMSQIGVEVDSVQEFKNAQEEKQQRDATAINNLNPQSNLADALAQLDVNQPGAADVIDGGAAIN